MLSVELYYNNGTSGMPIFHASKGSHIESACNILYCCEKLIIGMVTVELTREGYILYRYCCEKLVTGMVTTV